MSEPSEPKSAKKKELNHEKSVEINKKKEKSVAKNSQSED